MEVDDGRSCSVGFIDRSQRNERQFHSSNSGRDRIYLETSFCVGAGVALCMELWVCTGPRHAQYNYIAIILI